MFMEEEMVYLDKYGWPVERIKGRWFLNFMRLLIHTNKILNVNLTEYLKTRYNPKSDEDTQSDRV